MNLQNLEFKSEEVIEPSTSLVESTASFAKSIVSTEEP